MDTSTVTVVTALITGSVALIGVYLTNYNNTKRLKLELEYNQTEKNRSNMIDKIEELYNLSDKWLKNIFMNYNNLILVLEGKLHYNEYLDLIINRKGDDLNFSRLEMLLHMYFNNLIPFYKEVANLRDIGNDISHKYKLEYENGNFDSREFIQPFLKIQKDIINSGEVFKQEIIRKATKI